MKKCKYCMSEIDENAKICPNCRKKQNEKSYIKIIIIIVILIIILYVLGTIIQIKEKNKQNLSNITFNSEINKFKLNYLTYCSNLENIANAILSYWHDSIFEKKYDGDINKAIEQALEDNKDTIDEAKTEKDEISKSYNNIRSLECYSDYCDEMKDEIKNAYNLYLDFYSLAISPSGNYNNYNDKFSKIDSESIKHYNNIKDLQDLFKNN